jgi:phosphoglycolate phosphatase
VHDHDFTVGFDLDMTLADTRAGIGAVLDALSAESGVFIDSTLSVTRLGPPLAIELANWFTADKVPVMVARFRELYAGIAIPVTTPMAGAAAALAAVRAAGGRVVVVTAKTSVTPSAPSVSWTCPSTASSARCGRPKRARR